MTDTDWRALFVICARVLGPGNNRAAESRSWCAWTTFGSLSSELTYWTSGLPNADELTESGTTDGGTWGQPFAYMDIAHLLIPRQFYWEKQDAQGFQNGIKVQDIDAVSRELAEASIPHRVTNLVLEIKLF